MFSEARQPIYPSATDTSRETLVFLAVRALVGLGDASARIYSPRSISQTRLRISKKPSPKSRHLNHSGQAVARVVTMQFLTTIFFAATAVQAHCKSSITP